MLRATVRSCPVDMFAGSRVVMSDGHAVVISVIGLGDLADVPDEHAVRATTAEKAASTGRGERLNDEGDMTDLCFFAGMVGRGERLDDEGDMTDLWFFRGSVGRGLEARPGRRAGGSW